jgi:hypothetical protein
MESIATQQAKIIPDILIGGNGDNSNGAISGLLGLQLLEKPGKKGIGNGDTHSKTDTDKKDNA